MIAPDYEKAMNSLFEPFSKKEIDQAIKMFKILKDRLLYALEHESFLKIRNRRRAR